MTRTAAWHVDDPLAARYAAGKVPETDAWSLEKHLEACGECAARVSAAVRAGAAGPVLAEVRGAVLAAAAGAPVGAAAVSAAVMGRGSRGWPRVADGRRVGGRVAPRWPVRAVGGRVGRVLWAAGPALRGAWLVAVVLVGAGAIGLAYGAGFDGARSLLLVLAPMVPVAGVALSYGRHADPMYELGASTPSGGLRLVLTRTAAVLAVSLPLLTAAGASLPPATGTPGAAAWLLPGLALTLAVLTLGSYVGCRIASGVVGALWGLAVVLAAAGDPDLAGYPAPADIAQPLALLLDAPAVQGGWAVAAVVCAGALALRRTSFDRLESL
ncbi:MAG TPA: zf-HC2 domain-containing protein [Streptomyces sp.]|nr:zf-HC2 domain-containing protein [Streptomyces sp.]